MAFVDRLPDRPLTFEEFQALQRNEHIDALYTADSPDPIDFIKVVIGEQRATYHHTDDKGRHSTAHES